MSFKGTLTINVGISRLDSTRLMKGAKNNGGFGRATDFLQQDRKLKTNDFIEVDGSSDTFGEIPIILMTDARRASPQDVIGETALAAIRPTRKQRTTGTKSTKRKKAGKTKKPATKRSRKTKRASKKRASPK